MNEIDRTRNDARAADEAVRELIRTRLGDNAFIEAGAGTGKTRALVERYIAHLLDGVPVERIVAITFTEKAAAELKDRIRAELERMLPDANPDGAELLKSALSSLDRARISTIHAFGMSLLRQFAAEAAVDPAFDVQDQVLAERRFDEAWTSELHRLAGDPAAREQFELVMKLGLGAKELRALARDIAVDPGLADLLLAHPVTAPEVQWPDLKTLAAELDALELDTAPPDEQRRRVEAVRSVVRRVIASEDRALALAVGSGAIQQNIGAQVRGWDAKRKKLVTETGKRIAAELCDVLKALRAEALAKILPTIAEFVRAYGERCRRDGALTFDDLIVGPARLLASNDAARATMQTQFDVMLIDEFQDTDPLQVDIALAFAADPVTGAPAPGRLMLVGDPKQSIYRFRRADIAVYERTSQRVHTEDGPPPALALNRRSRKQIVEWVNHVFGRVIGPGLQLDVQPPYRAIDWDRDIDLKGPGVAVIGGFSELNARDLRRQESEQVAAWCRAAVERGWQVQDRDVETGRGARYRDIAVLIPTRTGLSSLERALHSAGVPFRVEGGSLIYQTQEVRDLLNALSAIDDPSDEVAIVAALRSPAFACSDVDLAQWKVAGGRFSYLGRKIDPDSGPVAAGLSALGEFHSDRHTRSLAVLVERFIAARGLDETALLADGTRDGFRRLRYVVEQARAFEASGPETLRAFVAWMEHRAGAAILDREGAGLDDDEDAVRITTIHAAKGLEFPIVFVAGLCVSPSKRQPPIVRDRVGEAVAFRIGTKSRNNLFEVGDGARLYELEERHAAAERDRLLYVAATRARDHLVVALYHNKYQLQSAAARLEQNQVRTGARPLKELERAAPLDAPPFTDLSVERVSAVGGDLASRRAALLSRAQTRTYTSATAIKLAAAASEAKHAPQDEKQERQDETEPWARGRGGTRLGRAVHAAIQSLPLAAGAEAIEAHARAQSVAEAIPDRHMEVAQLVTAALASSAAARARESRALREVPFAVRRDGAVVEGFLDMLIDGDDGLEIVDWKTDHVTAGQVAERLRDYELQAGLYVLGIEAATGREVARLTYVFVHAGIERSPGDPRALATAAAGQLAASA